MAAITPAIKVANATPASTQPTTGISATDLAPFVAAEKPSAAPSFKEASADAFLTPNEAASAVVSAIVAEVFFFLQLKVE